MSKITRETILETIKFEGSVGGILKWTTAEMKNATVAAYNRGLEDAIRFIEDERVTLDGDEQDGYGMQLFLEKLDKLKI